MKTLNVTDATFEEFKTAKLLLQVTQKEEMSDSTALSTMLSKVAEANETRESFPIEMLDPLDSATEKALDDWLRRLRELLSFAPNIKKGA